MDTGIEVIEANFSQNSVERSPEVACLAPRAQTRNFTDCVWLICLLAIVAAFCVRPSHSADEDLWWHLRTGVWILQHHAVPTHDLFSAYTLGKPWVEYSWLFDILVAGVYGAWGLHGILTLTTLLTLSFIAAVVLLLSRYAHMLRAIALAACVFVVTAPLVTPRPWLFTCVFFVLELYFLLQAREHGQAVRLLPLVPLFALWANVHIQFIYGLGVIGLFAFERPLASLLKWTASGSKLSAGWYWTLLAVSTLATLANPYGWHLYAIIAEYAGQTATFQYLQEMQAMQFRSITDWVALALVCSALFAVAGARQKSALMLSLLTVSLWFGFHLGRDVWFLAVISALALASSREPAEQGSGQVRCLQWMVALPASLTAAFALLHSPGVSPKALQQDVNRRFPEAAVMYIWTHTMQPPLYNPFGWGGYLIWRLPSMPVSIDGRTNVHGGARLARFMDTWLGKANWSNDPELMTANTILLERDSALASILRSDSRFRMVYEDDIASVFQPCPAVQRGTSSVP